MAARRDCLQAERAMSVSQFFTTTHILVFPTRVKYAGRSKRTNQQSPLFFLRSGGREVVPVWAGHPGGSVSAPTPLHLRLQGRTDGRQDASKGPLHDALPLLCLHPSGHRLRRTEWPQHSWKNWYNFWLPFVCYIETLSVPRPILSDDERLVSYCALCPFIHSRPIDQRRCRSFVFDAYVSASSWSASSKWFSPFSLSVFVTFRCQESHHRSDDRRLILLRLRRPASADPAHHRSALSLHQRFLVASVRIFHIVHTYREIDLPSLAAFRSRTGPGESP